MKMPSQPLVRIWNPTTSQRTSFHVVQGNIIDDKAVQDEAGYEYYDIAVANILADGYHHAAERDPRYILRKVVFHHFRYHQY